MARVPYLEPSDLAPEDQDLLKRPIWLFKALVNSPKAARAFSGLGSYIRYGSKLDPRLRELAILQVGWLARSPYEWSHHVKLGHDFQTTGNCVLQSQWRGHHRGELPVNAESHTHFELIRLDVDITSSALNRVRQDQVDEFDDWSFFGRLFQSGEVHL